MIGAVVGLTMGFCAAMSDGTNDRRGESTIFLGYKVGDQCEFKQELATDRSAEHPETWVEHSWSWTQLDGGGEVCIDNQCFVIMAFRGA